MVSYYNWTGFYAGMNAGYGFGTSNWSLLPRTNIKPKGVLVGGTLGYNYQVGSHRLRPRRRLRLVEREGQRRLRAGS